MAIPCLLHAFSFHMNIHIFCIFFFFNLIFLLIFQFKCFVEYYANEYNRWFDDEKRSDSKHADFKSLKRSQDDTILCTLEIICANNAVESMLMQIHGHRHPWQIAPSPQRVNHLHKCRQPKWIKKMSYSECIIYIILIDAWCLMLDADYPKWILLFARWQFLSIRIDRCPNN